MDQTPATKIACTCPSGHKLRGDVSLSGQKVICPRCKQVFVFGVTESPRNSVSDTGVMRILTEGMTPNASAVGAAQNNRFDSAFSQARETPRSAASIPETNPCGRCGVAIDQTATVCKHCNSYVGAVPSFMQFLSGTPSTSRR